MYSRSTGRSSTLRRNASMRSHRSRISDSNSGNRTSELTGVKSDRLTVGMVLPPTSGPGLDYWRDTFVRAVRWVWIFTVGWEWLDGGRRLLTSPLRLEV